jgi:hypothetical protein
MEGETRRAGIVPRNLPVIDTAFHVHVGPMPSCAHQWKMQAVSPVIDMRHWNTVNNHMFEHWNRDEEPRPKPGNEMGRYRTFTDRSTPRNCLYRPKATQASFPGMQGVMGVYFALGKNGVYCRGSDGRVRSVQKVPPMFRFPVVVRAVLQARMADRFWPPAFHGRQSPSPSSDFRFQIRLPTPPPASCRLSSNPN